MKSRMRIMVPGFADRVQPVYDMLGWTWNPRMDGDLHVPSVAEVREALSGLIDGLTDDGGIREVSSGGLMAFIEDHEDGQDDDPEFGLKLEIAETRLVYGTGIRIHGVGVG